MSLHPSDALRRIARGITLASQRQPVIEVELPIATVNVANEHAHWRARQKRAKAQRTLVAMGLKARLRLLEVSPPLVVLIQRVSPRRLDDDGCAAALKSVRDGVADALGVDDGSEAVVWLTDQAKGRPREQAVRIAIWMAGAWELDA